MGILGFLSGFSMRKMVWKGIRRGLQVLLALLLAPAVQAKLAEYGITIDPNVSLAGLTAASEMLLNLAKQKAPKLFGWL